jgi:hypothetical protein
MAEADRVILVVLREPNPADPIESRADPFFELGSFGCTGCHAKNLMHPDKAHELAGRRLAFAQGGGGSFRLVQLTPPVQPVNHGERCEARWPAGVPMFRFDAAPVLVDNAGGSAVPRLRDELRGVNRSTWAARLSSAFRSRRRPLPMAVSRQLIRVWDRAVQCASAAAFAERYTDTMPRKPNDPRDDRRAMLAALRREARGREATCDATRCVSGKTGCGSRRGRSASRCNAGTDGSCCARKRPGGC